MKIKLDFILENAGWPALMVEATATIRNANQAAVAVFGPVVEGESSLLNSIWGAENDAPPEQFLLRMERSQGTSITLFLKVKGGATTRFRGDICQITRDNQRFFIFQLFNAARESGSVALADPAGPLPAVESSTAHKQKLDCALQLIRSVVLDFNNALTSILGHTSYLLGKADPNHPWRTALLEVEKSAERGAEIAQDLAAFSRQEKDTRAALDGNLNDLVRRSTDVFRTPEFAHVQWNLELEAKLFSVRFDEAKMQQAFVKILENSAQAMGAKGAVTVGTRNLELTQPLRDGTAALAPGRFVCAEFSDNGAGIPSEVLPRIFEPFFTTKPGHRGLGLAWVYGIVTNHGGSVAVSSVPGQGTTVRLYLPAERRLIRDHSLSDDDLRGDQWVLVVDDEGLMLTMAQLILSDFGYHVRTARSGEKALELLALPGPRIQLVITDLVMPQMSGRELMERIRRLVPEVKILCCSGYIRPVTAEEDEIYLQKPFTSQELLRKVKEALT